MKKLLGLFMLGLIVFLVIYHQRAFLRDPLATITRDGVKVADAYVMINYANDILFEDNTGSHKRIYLVQHWNMLMGTPAVGLKCFQGLACMTDADQATETIVAPGSRGGREKFEGVTMTDKRVEFVNEDGDLILVALR